MAAIEKAYKFSVEMTCEGCVNAVTNVLNRHKDQGINHFEVSLKDKAVTVKSSSLDKDKILEIIKKTGKTVSYQGEV